MAGLAVLGATLRKNIAVLYVVIIAVAVAALFPLWQILIALPGAQAALVHIIESDAKRLTHHLGRPLRVAPELLRGDGLAAGVAGELVLAMEEFGVEKIKLFTADGTLLWASDGAGIGERNSHAYFRDRVAQGQPYSKLVRKDRPSLEGQVLSRDVVESYAPVMADGRFLGAFEIYYDVTDHMAVLAAENRRSMVALGTLATLLLLLLVVVLRKALAAMRARDAAFAALEVSEDRFRDMAASAQDAIIEMDQDGRIAFWNAAAERIFGHPTADALGKDLHGLLAPKRFIPSFKSAYPRFLQTGEGAFIGRPVEMVGLRADGSEVSVEMSIAALGGRRRGHALGILRDITARKEVEQRLKLGARVMDYAMNGIIVTDAQQRIQLVNPAFTRLTGYTLAEVAGNTPNMLRSGRHNAEFYAAMWAELRDKGEWQGEVWNRRKSGEVFPEWLCLTAITDNQGRVTHYVAIFSDITQRKAAERDLERLAFYDPLTGVANRVLFRERVTQALREVDRYGGGQLVVFFLDLDWFKQVNDTWGHEVGDVLLQQVARRLERLMRSVDTVARLGGDEFAILAKSIPDETAATAIAGKIVSSLTEPFDLEGREVRIGTSIGIALFPDHATDAECLIRHADEAMYRAKRGGRNQYRVYQVEELVEELVEG